MCVAFFFFFWWWYSSNQEKNSWNYNYWKRLCVTAKSNDRKFVGWLFLSTALFFDITKTIYIEIHQIEIIERSFHTTKKSNDWKFEGIFDGIKATNNRIHEIEIKNEMLILDKSAWLRYKVPIEKTKKSDSRQKVSRRNLVTKEIDNVKWKRMEAKLYHNNQECWNLLERKSRKTLHCVIS